MSRDRDPTQVITSPTTPTPTTTTTTTSPPTPVDPLAGLSKIKQTALLLKQKVAGTNTKPQKQPNKISNPWTLNRSSRSASFPSPSSPSSSSSFSSPISPSLGGGGGTGGKATGIKAMIAAREDPSLSCNKMAPPGTQPIPAPQKREARAGMTKLQLSQPLPPSAVAAPAASVDTVGGQDRNDRETNEEEDEKEKEKEKEREREKEKEERERRREQTKRESIQEQQQQATSPTTTTPAPTVMECIPAPAEATTEPTTATDLAGKRSSRRRNGGGALAPSQFTSTPSPSSSSPPSSSSSSTSSPLLSSTTTTPSSSSSSSGSPVLPAFMKAFEDIRPIETVKISSTSEERPSTSSTMTATTTVTATTTRSSPMTSALPPLSPSLASLPPLITTGKTQPASVFDRPSLTPRRHTTTNSPNSPLTSSPFVPTRRSTPPVPVIPGLPVAAGVTSHHHQPMSVTNPTLRQLQTPNIPTNLVQARILQQEEQKRKDEELAKIPITANLRQVKKIQAVLVSDDEDDDPKVGGRSSSASSSASSSLSARSSTRPRSKTATATSQTSVPVSVLVGGKRRGDRNHVEPVAIPKRLADQVEHILGRKLAGKGSVLDEREKEREEEEARKAAEPLPPIVLGKPRKRAVTSAHIRNLVSSWDTKVEEAKELTSEAERIRLFLEERSTAHAELPKPKVAPTAEELLRPLPALPPPPSPSELHQLLVSGGVASSGSGTNLDAAGGGSVGRRRGRTVATSNGSGSGRSFGGHVKGASVASGSPSTTVQPLQKTRILLSTPSQNTFVLAAGSTSSSNKAVIVEEAALSAEQKDVEKDAVEVEPSTRRSALSTEALDTTKRTGELLVSKAAINRPRRKRATTVTQEAL